MIQKPKIATPPPVAIKAKNVTPNVKPKCTEENKDRNEPNAKQKKRISDPEEGEIETEEDDGNKVVSIQSSAHESDDDKDLATLMKERFCESIDEEKKHEKPTECDGSDKNDKADSEKTDKDDSDESDKDCSESEDALLNSPIDPIAILALEADVRTPSDAPGTPNTPPPAPSLEVDAACPHSRRPRSSIGLEDHIEIDEVNWELFKSERKIAYFRCVTSKLRENFKPSFQTTYRQISLFPPTSERLRQRG